MTKIEWNSKYYQESNLFSRICPLLKILEILKRVIYQSEMGDNFGFLSHTCWTPTQRKVDGPKTSFIFDGQDITLKR